MYFCSLYLCPTEGTELLRATEISAWAVKDQRTLAHNNKINADNLGNLLQNSWIPISWGPKD